MSVRKRKWTTQKGEKKEAWLVDYIDQGGERHVQTFGRKKDADEYHATVKVDVRHGTHTAPSKSLTVAEAAENWIKYVELEKRERSTIEYYRNHVDRHINPRLGPEKLAKLTTPRIQTFRDDLLATLSRPQARKVLTSLKSLLRDAKRRGNVAQNVAIDVSIQDSKRGKARLKAGVDIPTPDEIKRVVHAATGRARPILIAAMFTGLRSSELRGLRWEDVELKMDVIPKLALAVWKDQAKLALRTGQPPFLQCVHDKRPERNRAIAGLGFRLADLAETVVNVKGEPQI